MSLFSPADIFRDVISIPGIVSLDPVIVLELPPELLIIIIIIVNYLLIVLVDIALSESHHSEVHLGHFVFEGVLPLLVGLFDKNVATVKQAERRTR